MSKYKLNKNLTRLLWREILNTYNDKIAGEIERQNALITDKSINDVHYNNVEILKTLHIPVKKREYLDIKENRWHFEPAQEGSTFNENDKLKKHPAYFSLYEVINRDPAVAKHIKSGKFKTENFNNDHLYHLYTEVLKKSDSVPLAGIYKDLYFKFIDSASKDAGFSSFIEKHSREKVAEFTGVYFSQKRRKVSEFNFKITLTEGIAKAELTGFHFEKPDEVFVGYGYPYDHFYHFSLRGDNIFITVTLDVGNEAEDNFEKNNFKACISGLGSYRNLLFCEAILVKNNPVVNKTELSYAKDYVAHNRRMFTQKPFTSTLNESLETLVGPTHLNIALYEKFRKQTFRIINVTPGIMKISQSKLEIEDNFDCKIHYPISSKKQEILGKTSDVYKGHLSIKEGHPTRYFIKAYRDDVLYVHTVFEHKEEDGYYYRGAFCLNDISVGSITTGGNFYLVKDNHMQDNEIDFFTLKDFKKLYDNKLIELSSVTVKVADPKKRAEKVKAINNVIKIYGKIVEDLLDSNEKINKTLSEAVVKK